MQDRARYSRLLCDAEDPTLSALKFTQRERDLIAMLAQGLTDASAATRLQISARTVTNILRSLMDRLGVQNRFQLGLALGRLLSAETPAPLPGTGASGWSPPAARDHDVSSSQSILEKTF